MRNVIKLEFRSACLIHICDRRDFELVRYFSCFLTLSFQLNELPDQKEKEVGKKIVAAGPKDK